MMKFATISIGLLAVLISCNDVDVDNLAPSCIQQKIIEIQQGDVWNPPARIYSYSYQGKIVYLFPQRCCDIPSELYDETCNFICSPDGGITGIGDGNCPNFFILAEIEKLIWEDARE